MAPESESTSIFGQPHSDSIIEHVRRGVSHAAEAFRCYLSSLAADLEQRGEVMLRKAILAVAIIAVGVLGIGLLTVGLAEFITDKIGTPGAGQMIVGGGMMVIVVILFFAMREQKGK